MKNNPAPNGCIRWVQGIVNSNGSGYEVRQRCNGAGVSTYEKREFVYTPVINCGYVCGCYYATGYICWITTYDGNGQQLGPPHDDSGRSYYSCSSPVNPPQSYFTNCSGVIELSNYDTQVALFVPVTQCTNKTTGAPTSCIQNCGDPANPTYAGSTETSGDGLDNNCNGQIDEGIEICDNRDNDNNGEVDDACIGESCETNKQAGSSARISSGNLFQDQYLHRPDFQIFYNSLSTYSGPLGRGWTHDYNINISEDNGSSLALMKPDGNKVYFWLSGGTYNPEARTPEYSTIVKNGNGTYTRTTKGGTVYNFNSSGQLTSIIDRNGNTTALAYTNGDLTSVTDKNGRVSQLSYDGSHRIIQFTGIDSQASMLAYNASGYLTSVMDPANNSWNYTYDANGRMLTKRDPAGNQVSYAYDSQGRMIASTDAQNRVKTFAYDQTNDIATVTERDGGVWTFKYDAVYDVVLEMNDPLGNVTKHTYDTERNLTRKTNPDNTYSTYTYDSSGNMLTKTDELGQTTEYTYNSFGQVTSEKDVASNTIKSFAYDSNGNLTSSTDASGAVSQFQYDARGNLTRTIDPALNETTLVYNANNNLLSITDPASGVISITYDSAGRPSSQTNAAGATTAFVYDNLGRLTTITEPGNAVTQFSYDANGNTTSVTDANNRTTTYAYNPDNLVTSETNALGHVTTYTYGSTGCGTCNGGVNKLTALTDARTNATNFTYDRLGRVLTETDPLGNTFTYTYDSEGNLSSRRDANLATTTYTYDDINRLTSINYPDSTSVTYQYDSKNNITGVANANISYTYAYDANGRVTSVTDSSNRTISYTYDSRGNRTQMTTPDGRVLQYAYDSNNRLTGITPATGQTFAFAYDSADRRTSLTYPNGVTATYSYDTRSRLTSLVYNTSTASTIDTFAYTLDNVGNRLTRIDRDYQYAYSYDATYRLTQSEPTPVAQGPLFSQSMEAFTYDAVGNRLTAPAYPKSSAYSQNYTYDYDNRLIGVTKQITGNPNADTISFKYDPFGRRIEKSVSTYENGTTTTYKYTYVYDNEDIILEIQEKTQNGNTVTTNTAYTHGPGIDEPLSLERGGNKYYYHTDGLGSITSITDSSEATVNRYTYNSFGAINKSETIRNAYTYTGREYDNETGLYYYRARYYDPEAGRFVSKDPIGFVGGDVNVYGYVENGPNSWLDPWGLFKLPKDPSGLPPEWNPDPSYRHPHGEKFIDPSGRDIYCHKGRPGLPGWRGKDHWHDPKNFGDEHLPPGTEIPDAAKPPIPWWQKIPLRWPGPFPIIIDPCVLVPSLPWCGNNGPSA
ncbi:MAG: RHS repeat protein [Deltaproteobacteria bacterium]|nr:RHS repeat protein [Deltaproteobacteria bacterium]